jgi:hypothetical protein
VRWLSLAVNGLAIAPPGWPWSRSLLRPRYTRAAQAPDPAEHRLGRRDRLHAGVDRVGGGAGAAGLGSGRVLPRGLLSPPRSSASTWPKLRLAGWLDARRDSRRVLHRESSRRRPAGGGQPAAAAAASTIRGQRCAPGSAWTVRPVRVVVPAIRLTATSWLVSGWPRQFIEIWLNSRCSISIAVPLGGARREVADGDRQPGLGCQVGQFTFPQPQPVSVGAATVGGDQQPVGSGVGEAPDLVPPAADRLDRELAGVVVGPHRYLA